MILSSPVLLYVRRLSPFILDLAHPAGSSRAAKETGKISKRPTPQIVATKKPAPIPMKLSVSMRVSLSPPEAEVEISALIKVNLFYCRRSESIPGEKDFHFQESL